MTRAGILLLTLIGAPLAAQQPIQAALDLARAQNEWTLAQQVSICEIPAPPFKESVRAAEMQRRFAALGMTGARLDGIGNVIAEWPGRSRKPVVVLSAHLDTVFPEGTDVRVRRSGSVFSGPGIGDDCRGLAVLLMVARALSEATVRLEGTIVFVATVGEEGLGNARGARHLVEKEMPGAVDYFITVDSDEFDVITRAVGSNRYDITFRGPGGHSYDDFSMPHPLHAMGRAIAKIGALTVPADPKTTFNVGVVKGGTAVNAIAATATMTLDLRSESPVELERLDRTVRQLVAEAVAEEKARYPGSPAALVAGWETLGNRPAGIVPDTSRLLQVVASTARSLGGTPRFASGSTDANIPISTGVSAVAIGHGGRGTAAHSLGERYDDGTRGYLGPQWVLLIAAALAGSQ